MHCSLTRFQRPQFGVPRTLSPIRMLHFYALHLSIANAHICFKYVVCLFASSSSHLEHNKLPRLLNFHILSMRAAMGAFKTRKRKTAQLKINLPAYKSITETCSVFVFWSSQANALWKYISELLGSRIWIPWMIGLCFFFSRKFI